jgi:preprotein translocase subunit SecG
LAWDKTLDKAGWHQIILVLKQKSTLLGLASLIAIIYSLFGSDMTPEQVTSVTGALAALLSVVAIVLQPKGSGEPESKDSSGSDV